jgi:hypothetical protein
MHIEEMSVTYDWLAWRIGCSASAVGQWVNGEGIPKTRLFLRVCRLMALATQRPFTDIVLEAANCVDNQECR